MKKSILTAIALLLVSTLVAQTVKFRVGEKGNSKGYQPSMIVVDRSDTEGLYLCVEPDLNAFSKVKGIVVREVDIDYGEHRRLHIDNSKGAGIAKVIHTDNVMHILLYQGDKNLDDRLRHVAIDKGKFIVVSDSVMPQPIVEKGFKYYHWEASSPNNNYYAMVYALHNEKKGKCTINATLFGRDLHCVWNQPLDTRAISQIMVTDSGEIVTAGYILGETAKEGAEIVFCTANADAVHSGSYPSVHPVSDLALLGYHNNKVICTALETSGGTGWAGSFATGPVLTIGTIYTSCVAFLFDMTTGRMLNVDRHTFSQDDVRVFYNASLLSELTSSNINMLTLHKAISLPDGGAALYGRTWEETVKDRANITHTVQLRGMMLFHIDTLGHINWTHGIMHNNLVDGYLIARTQETDLVAFNDGTACVLTQESASDAPEYTTLQKAHPPIAKANGILAAYLFPPDGTAHKIIVNPGSTNRLMTPLRPQGDGGFTFISGTLRGHISEITFPKS